MKLCKKCGVEKPETEFYIMREAADGLQVYCKSCVKGYGASHKVHKKITKFPLSEIQGNKRCLRCGKDMPFTPENFIWKSKKTGRLRQRCRACAREMKASWRLLHPDKASQYARTFDERHPNYVPPSDQIAHMRALRRAELARLPEEKARIEANKLACRRRYGALRAARNKAVTVRKLSVAWGLPEAEVVRLRLPENTRERKVFLEKRAYAKKKASPVYRMFATFRTNLRRRLKTVGHQKTMRTVKYLGCSVSEFRSHLESQFTPEMSWDNYGTFWHVDHIRPIASFDQGNYAELSTAWHYTNLRPLPSTENMRKGSLWQGVRWVRGVAA